MVCVLEVNHTKSIVFIMRLTIQITLSGPIYSVLGLDILIVGGVHGWVGVGLLRLLLLVAHNHLHCLGPGDLRLLLLGLVIVHSCGSLSLNVGQVLERRHLDDN